MKYFKSAAPVLHLFFHRTNVHSHRIPFHLLVLVKQSFHEMEYCYDHIRTDTVNLVLVAIDIDGREIKQVRQFSFAFLVCFLKPRFYVPLLFLCAFRIFRMEKREDKTLLMHSPLVNMVLIDSSDLPLLWQEKGSYYKENKHLFFIHW